MHLAVIDLGQAVPGAQAGVAFSLSTALCWAIGPMFMASAARRVGSHAVNLLRILLSALALGLIVLPAYMAWHGHLLDLPAPAQWAWLAVSAVFGLAVGDACFYEALVRLGARRAIKVNTLAPVVALAVGWAWLGEELGARALVGAGLVIAAVTYVAFAEGAPARRSADDDPAGGYRLAGSRLAMPAGGAGGTAPDAGGATSASRLRGHHVPRGTEPGRMTPAGLAFALGSAVSIALGSVALRRAFLVPDAGRPLDPIVATVIRVVTAAAVLWALHLAHGSARSVTAHLADRPVRNRVLVGTLLGPLLGMLFYVTAFRTAEAGLVSTLVSTSTLVVIPLTAIRYRVRIRPGVVVAAAVAVVGVSLISWRPDSRQAAAGPERQATARVQAPLPVR